MQAPTYQVGGHMNPTRNLEKAPGAAMSTRTLMSMCGWVSPSQCSWQKVSVLAGRGP